MSNDVDDFTTDAGGRHERPFLYSWNRRLRHLQGVSLRNLNVTVAKPRTRGKTITDDEVPYNLRTPSRMLAQADTNALQHSKSFSDLSSPLKESPRPTRTAMTTYERSTSQKEKPGLRKLRRSSTLHWTGASPRARQQKLEDVTESRLADNWFSLHAVHASDQPIYISEVMEKSMNPTFRFFDLDAAGPSVTRLDELKLRVWAKTDRMEEYMQLVEIDLNLRSLQFVGRTLEHFHHPLPPNCVLFHISDGIYTSFTDMPSEEHGIPFSNTNSQGPHIASTSSYDALMQLANLDDCIQDALNTRRSLEGQINALLDQNQRLQGSHRRRDQINEQVASTDYALSMERRTIKNLQKRKDEIRAGLQRRRQRMLEAESAQGKLRDACKQAQKNIGQVQRDIEKATESSTGQIRRICEDLLLVFPIEPLKNKTLQFSIRGTHLPNSAFDDTNRDDIAAALGMTSRLVHMLSLYLSAPLPYPIIMDDGSPYIRDPVSMALPQRRFPLHPTNVAYKFEYGVFLLNKDIEFLMSKAGGLRMFDIRHTLPNLKYLLYVLTAGTGELPARKAGGVRGLLGGRLTPSMSRRSSQDSVFSSTAPGVKALSGIDHRNGSIPIPGVKKEKGEEESEDPFLISPGTRTRTTGIAPSRKSLLASK